jgi:hypothetical protein
MVTVQAPTRAIRSVMPAGASSSPAAAVAISSPISAMSPVVELRAGGARAGVGSRPRRFSTSFVARTRKVIWKASSGRVSV